MKRTLTSLLAAFAAFDISAATLDLAGGGEVADPEECKTIADLGVDMLAAGIGNIHGVYPENWPGLSF